MKLMNVFIVTRSGGYIRATMETEMIQTMVESVRNGERRMWMSPDKMTLIDFGEVAGIYCMEIEKPLSDKLAEAQIELVDQIKQQANRGEEWRDNE